MTTSAKRNGPAAKSDGQRLSMATENYLLSIYRLDEQGVRVTSSQLAAHLKTLPVGEGMGTSLPSVVGMVRRMVREGLVRKASNKYVVLTREGQRFAEGIVRRHRLAERMVVDLLGLEIQKAHVEAHRLEHAISDELERKIFDRLGGPTTCPFGHPIPGSGYVAPKRAITLDRSKAGQRLVIDRIPEDDQSLLEYFVENGLVPGQEIVVGEVSTSRGVISLECGGNEIVFSYRVASLVWVYAPPSR